MRGSRSRRRRWEDPPNCQAGPIRKVTNNDLLFLTSAYLGEKHTTLYSEFFNLQDKDEKGKREAALWLAQEIRNVLGDEFFVITNKIPPEVPVEERKETSCRT